MQKDKNQNCLIIHLLKIINIENKRLLYLNFTTNILHLNFLIIMDTCALAFVHSICLASVYGYMFL
jgi:hypothetical protein